MPHTSRLLIVFLAIDQCHVFNVRQNCTFSDDAHYSAFHRVSDDTNFDSLFCLVLVALESMRMD